MGKHRISKEIVNQAINLYKLGKSTYEVAKALNVSSSWVHRIVQDTGISRSKLDSVSISLDIQQEIIKYYLEGNSHYSINKKFGTSRNTSLAILKKHNVKRRDFFEINKIRKYNNNYFDIIDTKDKAYFLGLLVSDGCNHRIGFSISLQEEDGYILENFKNYIEYDGKINKYKAKKKHWKQKWVLSICDKKLSNDLSKWGCVPAKSFKTYFPPIPEHLWHHFIRGVFDGDGSICHYKMKKHFTIVGNYELIQEIQNILVNELGIYRNKLCYDKRCNENFRILHITRQEDIQKIYHYLYKDCEDLYLTRKKKKFEQI